MTGKAEAQTDPDPEDEVTALDQDLNEGTVKPDQETGMTGTPDLVLVQEQSAGPYN